MEEHVTNAYNGLQGLGADLTNVNKNIENISMVLDDIYDSMPQVSGEGTNLTLDDTRVGKIKSTLKGNTSQTTYSGKNLLPNNVTSGTRNGITWVVNNDGTILINGTATAQVNISTSSYYFPIDGAYIVSGCPSGGNSNTYSLVVGYYDENKAWKAEAYDTGSGKVLNQNYAYANVGILIRSGTTCNNLLFKPMLEAGSQVTSYEPYVGGTASPNPQYPQPVNVVSGDNEIEVCGKNLLPNNQTAQTINGITFTINSDKSVSLSGTATSITDLYFVGTYNSYGTLPLETGTYNLNGCSGGDNSTYMLYCVGNRNGNLYYYQSINDSGRNIIIEKGDTFRFFIRVMNGVSVNTTIYPQLEKGSSASTYEPYQGNTYNIDLPVENLLQCNIVSTTTGGVTITNNNDESFTLQGTATVGIGRDIHGEITLKAGTYTFSADHLPAGVYISLANVSNTILNRATPSRTFTISTDTTYAKCLLWIDSGYTVNDTIKIQLEKGSKQNNFTPYGTTPIELGLISTYKDKLIRTSGKNLFDIDSISNGFLDESGIVGGDTSAYRTSDFIPILPNTAYYKTTTSSPRTKYYDKNKQPFNTTTYWDIPIGGNAGTFTTPSNAYYFRFSYPVTGVNVNSIMINKGTTAIDYEPYGSGEWYNYEAISQKILNGSENWGKSSKTQVNRYFVANVFVTLLNASSIDLISNYFVCITPNQSDSNNIGLAKYNENGLMVNFSLTDTNFDTLEKFKTWLTSNNVLVRYVLATPTYNKITYEPLLEQLEAYYHAKSKATQTNIFQENNDLPFEIDASALKEWSV